MNLAILYILNNNHINYDYYYKVAILNRGLLADIILIFISVSHSCTIIYIYIYLFMN